jgi:hypothetical protein
MELMPYEIPALPAVQSAPARGSLLAKAMNRLAGPPSRSRRVEPRKGASTAGVPSLVRLQAAGIAEGPASKSTKMNMAVLKNLAERDDIIYSCRKAIRMALGELPWKIVPNLDAIKADLKQWQTMVLVNLALPGMDLNFTPQSMNLELYMKARGALRDILRDALIAGEDPASSPRVRGFFENVLAAHDAVAQSHIAEVQKLFKRPNETETSFRSLLDLVIDDITLYDAGILIKNPTLDGRIGELYHLPGEEIRIYRAKDRSTPRPPHVAYDWTVNAQTRAFFNNDELTYMMVNCQKNGYGMSPVEVLIEQMIGAIYADAYLVDAFANNNMPYFVFDLGPNIDEGERRAAETRWDERVSKGQHRGLFLANKDGVKGFMPIPAAQDKDSTTIDKLKFWANRKTAAFGLSLNDIGFTEDLHRTTSETQADLTQSRGIESNARVVEEYLNGEVVCGWMWVRDDPEDPNSFAGKSVPCFPYRDVMFEFQTSKAEDRLKKAEELLSQVKAGAISINEVRREMGQPPVPGGDVHVCFEGTPIKIEDLPNIPPPQAATPPGAPGADPFGGQKQDGKEAPGAPGQEDPKQTQPGQNQPPKKPNPFQAQDQTQKGLNSLEQFADRLRKLVAGEELTNGRRL